MFVLVSALVSVGEILILMKVFDLKVCFLFFLKGFSYPIHEEAEAVTQLLRYQQLVVTSPHYNDTVKRLSTLVDS